MVMHNCYYRGYIGDFMFQAKAVRFHKTGGSEVLQLDDIQVGDPGQGQVRVSRRDDEQLAILNVFQVTKPTIAHQYANL